MTVGSLTNNTILLEKLIQFICGTQFMDRNLMFGSTMYSEKMAVRSIKMKFY